MAAAAAAQQASVNAVCQAVYEITRSRFFCVETLAPQKRLPLGLRMSEAYCLLWRDTQSGDLPGRRTNPTHQAGLFGACILDLVALGRVSLRIKEKTFLGHHYQRPELCIDTQEPTNLPLDAACFTTMVERERRKPQQPKDLIGWANQYRGTECSRAVLTGLVERGILAEEHHHFGNLRYTLADPTPGDQLVAELRAVTLHGAQPSCFLRILLTLCYSVEANEFGFHFLRQQGYTHDEWKLAEPVMAAIAKEVRGSLQEETFEMHITPNLECEKNH